MSASVLLQGLEWGRGCAHSLATLREEGTLCDTVIIGSDNQRTMAHSCVLAASSPVLKSLLGKRKGFKTIKSEISTHLWNMILKFVYTSEVLVPLDDIMSLKDIYNAAKALDLTGLRDAAREFISEDMILMSENELNKSQPPLSPGFRSIVSLSFSNHPLENTQCEKTCLCRSTQTGLEGSDNEDVTEIKVPVVCDHRKAQNKTHCDEDKDNSQISSSAELGADDSNSTEASSVDGDTMPSLKGNCQKGAVDNLLAANVNEVSTSQDARHATPVSSEALPITVAPDSVGPSVTENGQLPLQAGAVVVSAIPQIQHGLQTVDTAVLQVKEEVIGDSSVSHSPTDVLDAAMREIGELSVSEDEDEEMPDAEAGHHTTKLVPRANKRVKLVKLPNNFRAKSPVDKSAPVYCPVCNKLLKNGAHSLNAHMTVHRKENPLKCEFCDYTTHKEGDFRKHKANHTGEKAFKCEQCSYSTNRPHDLKMHMKRHAGEKPYGCKSCGKTFVKKSELKTHMMTHSGEKPHQCDYCEKSFRRRYDLSSHLLTHTDEKPYRCELCEGTFKRRKELEDHIASVHIEVPVPEIQEPEPFRCTDCGFTAKSKRSLQAHVAASHNEVEYKCDKCQKTFKSKPLFLGHLKTHTGRPYECSHCGDDLETQLRLKAHLSEVHGETIAKLTCVLCEKDYPNKNAFNTHMHKVHRKNPYMCHICGAIFKYAVNLRTHEMFHRGEKPHECEDCGKKFTQKLDLKRHKMVHTGEKPFLCTYCPFATTRKGYLKIHEMSHTGLKPHICSICSERFKIRSDLKIHMKKVHDIEIPMKVSRLSIKGDDDVKREDSDEDDEDMDIPEDEYTFHDEDESDHLELMHPHMDEEEDITQNLEMVEMSMEGVVAAQQVVYQEGDVPDAKTAETALQMAEDAAMQSYTLAAESLAELSQYVVNPENLVQQEQHDTNSL